MGLKPKFSYFKTLKLNGNPMQLPIYVLSSYPFDKETVID